jgi:hypothetical protein
MKANDTGRMPPPLQPSVEALLAHERVPIAQSEMVRARALARAREALREAPSATLPPRVASTRCRRLLFAAAAGMIFLAGVAAAFQIMSRPAPTPPPGTRTPQAPRQAPVLPPSSESGLTPPKEAEPAAPAASANVSVPSRRTVLTDKHDGRLEELQILSRARQSDARGDYAEVLAIAAEHARSHPVGRLSEEREVLRVKALVGLGRDGEARLAAAKFRRQFPRSVLLQKIDDMLASLP